MAAGKWQVLDDVFWTVIPFGTGGRRGKMYPIGSNAINDRTIGESAQGLADYVKETLGAGATLSCAIGYDTRHRSDHFAQLCAEIMTAAGFTVYFLKGYRATPELSFTVREKKCSCGIMVTASHNPPSDNAVKVYWSTGGQILPPHDKGIIERVMNTQEIQRADFDEDAGRRQDRDVPGGDGRQVSAGGDDAGVAGAAQVEGDLFAAAWRGGDMRDAGARGGWLYGSSSCSVRTRSRTVIFRMCRGMWRIRKTRRCSIRSSCAVARVGADVALATDPDCDRIGCAAPLTFKPRTPSGTRSPAISFVRCLADYVLENRKSGGTAFAAAFHRDDAGHDADGPPHRRQLRRARPWTICSSASSGSPRRSISMGRTCSCTAPRNRTATWPAATRATRTARWPRCCCASWPPS